MPKISAYFDHAAIAVTEPEKLTKVLLLLGLKDEGTEEVATQGVLTHFIVPVEKSKGKVEILEPTDPNGVIQKFLNKKGPGIHHLCFRVNDIEAATAILRKESIRLVYESAQPGAHHTKVNFIHPESTGGVLIEISQGS